MTYAPNVNLLACCHVHKESVYGYLRDQFLRGYAARGGYLRRRETPILAVTHPLNLTRHLYTTIITLS